MLKFKQFLEEYTLIANKNIDAIDIKQNPEYELKLINRTLKTNESEIATKIEDELEIKEVSDDVLTDLTDDISKELDELLTKKELEEVLSEIHVFYNQKKEFIIEGITNYKENCLLFSQPILIFAAYLIINHQSITIINWPFNYDSLKKLFSTMDISLDVLNDYIQ